MRGTRWMQGASNTAIQPLVIGPNAEALAVMQGLAERGLARVDANATYFVGPRLRVLAKD